MPTTQTTGTQSFGPQNVADIPSQQLGWLKNLSDSNQLSGIPWQYLAVIDQAESSGMGGSVNNEGYGGFFGLAANTNYPNGSITTSQLTGTDQASFNAQAVTAAAELASLVQQNNGNVYAAENQYQGGSTEGSSLMAQYGLPSTLSTSSLTSPTSPGGASTSTSGSGSTTSSSASGTTTSGSVLGACDSSKSALEIPLLGALSGIPLIGSAISKATTISILNQCQAKALISAGIVLGGGLVMLVGVAILASGSSTGKKLIAIAPVGYAAEQLGKIGGGGGKTETVSGPATLPPLGSSSKRTHSGYRMNAGDSYDDSGEF